MPELALDRGGGGTAHVVERTADDGNVLENVRHADAEGLRPCHCNVGRDRKGSRDRLRLAVVVIDRTELVAVASALLAGNRNREFFVQGKVFLENRPSGRLALAVFPELALNHAGRRVRTEARDDTPDHGGMQGDVRDACHSRRLRPRDCQSVGRRDRHETCFVNRVKVGLHPVVAYDAGPETHLVHRAVEAAALFPARIGRIWLRGTADADIGIFLPHWGILREYLIENAVGIDIDDRHIAVCRILPDKVDFFPDAVRLFQPRTNVM